MQARCNVVALCSWWMLTRLHCAKLQAAAGAPAKESDSSERVLEKLAAMCPTSPSIHPSIHPSLSPACPPACSFAPFPSPLAPHLISFYVTRVLSPFSPPRRLYFSHRHLSSPPTPSLALDLLSRARVYLLLPPLCPAASLTFRRPPSSRTSSFQPGIDCETPSRARYGDGEGGEGRRRR